MNQSLEQSSLQQYHLVRIGKRPFMAFPSASRQIRLSAVKCYPAQTWRKKVFRFTIWLIVNLGLDKFIWRGVDSLQEFLFGLDLGSWLEIVQRGLIQPETSAVVIWPAQADRGRVYVHLLSKNGQPISFAKLSLDSANDEQIVNEAKALETLHNLDLQYSRVPSIQSQGICQGRRYLVTETIPIDATLLGWSIDRFPRQSVEEYAGIIEFITFPQIKKISWWQRFWDNCNNIPQFAEEVRRCAEKGIEVCRVHGDMGSTNLFQAKDKLWLVDWEQSSEQGPKLVDEIAFYLASQYSQIEANPMLSFHSFSQKYLSNPPQLNHRNAVMALLFLHGAKFPLATKLIKQWEHLNELKGNRV